MRWLYLATLSLMACGPSFSGDYAGVITEAGTCNNGRSGVDRALPSTWGITQWDDGSLTVEGTFCQTLKASAVSAEMANVDPKVCASIEHGDGTSSEPRVTSGSLEVGQGGLTVNLGVTEDIYGTAGVLATCLVTATGTLQ
jgi:hypothetical protein